MPIYYAEDSNYKTVSAKNYQLFLWCGLYGFDRYNFHFLSPSRIADRNTPIIVMWFNIHYTMYVNKVSRPNSSYWSLI